MLSSALRRFLSPRYEAQILKADSSARDLRVLAVVNALPNTPATPEGLLAVVVKAFRPAHLVIVGAPVTVPYMASVTTIANAADWRRSHPAARVDAVFHNGEHSAEAYIRDFAALHPVMTEGAVWLLNALHWHDPHALGGSMTYQGWEAIADHSRVTYALEIGRPSFFRDTLAQLGLAVLR